MIVTGDAGVLGEKPCPVPLCPPKISHGLTWDRTRTSAVERHPSAYRAVNTLRLGYKNQSVNAIKEIIAVCSQIHTKHTNTLCGQNVELLTVQLTVHIVTTGL